MSSPINHTSSATPLPALPLLRDPAIQAALDEDHLRLLEIGFYISGALTAFRFIWFLALASIFALGGLGAAFAAQHNTGSTTQNPPPAIVFFILAGILGVIIVTTLVFAGLEVYAGRCLKKRQHPILIQVVAGLYCLSVPWGTALGVFTFFVLNRSSVKVLFSEQRGPLEQPPAI